MSDKHIPIKLSDKTLNLCKQIDDLKAALHHHMELLNDSIINDTDGLLSVCTGLPDIDRRIQLFDESNHPGDVLDALRHSAAELLVNWSDRDTDEVCFKFQLHDRPFLIVLEDLDHEADA